ncbi:MAG: nucleotide exchange factor GrpE, partial [Planctomycetes bacterium]|nr:nucleotide exchange factor GrpE [Planctomycetota bacterium]
MRAEQPGEEQAPEEVETSNGAQAAAERGGEPVGPAEDVAESERPETPPGAVAQEHGRLFERLQRVSAELENYRKRVDREREQWRRYALENFLKDLLATIDSLERAIQAARQSGDLEGLLAGLELIDRELHQTLERHGVQPIEALGQT